MKGQKKKRQARRVGKNVRFLRLHFDLTVFGLAAALDLSANHLRRIESGKVNIRKSTALKIYDFFNIDRAVLYGSAFPEKREKEEIPAVTKFYRENKRNKQFFMTSKAENSVSYFIREILLKKKKYFRKEKRTAGDVAKESERKEYQKNFKSKEVSQPLLRLAKKRLLMKDPTGKGKRFLYYESE